MRPIKQRIACTGTALLSAALLWPALAQFREASRLVGTGAVGAARQGTSVAVSGGGHTVVAGGPSDNGNIGAVWVFTQSSGSWSQQTELSGNNAVGAAQQGNSIALSADGNTGIVGGPGDNNSAGAAWVFTQSGEVWSQQAKLVGNNPSGAAAQGTSVALSNRRQHGYCWRAERQRHDRRSVGVCPQRHQLGPTG
jgi:hypothetical protein